MSYREGPKTIDQLVAYIDERLRNVNDNLRFRADVNMGAGLTVGGILAGGLAFGTVTSINWSTATEGWGFSPPTVNMLLDDGTAITARCTDWPPPPRSRAICWLGSDGVWRHLETDGGRRLISFDDFTHVAVVAATLGYGDTIWRQRGTLGTIIPTYAPPSQGVIHLASSAAAGANLGISKSDLTVVAVNTLWFSARVRLPSPSNSLTSLLTGIGLASDDIQTFNIAPGAADTAVFAQRQDGVDGGNWSFRTVNQAVLELRTNTNYPAVLDEWVHLDIVHAATSGWAAMWVNGTGPTVHTGSSLPPVTSGYEAFATIYPLAASIRRLDVDWIRLEQFPYAVSPV